MHTTCDITVVLHLLTYKGSVRHGLLCYVGPPLYKLVSYLHQTGPILSFKLEEIHMAIAH